MKLIIVESPTKAKTISQFLGRDFNILSSYGHIRDLPKSSLGVDVEQDFKPQYVIPLKAEKHVSILREAAAKADNVILATDEDREGEAIAWHIAQILNLGNAPGKIPNSPALSDGKSGTDKFPRPFWRKGRSRQIPNYQRIVFHEITKGAIEEALKNPREIDINLVDAQQARRILDRLVGYKLSPFLWKKVARGLSAGRVQSVTVRLIVEREREIESFKSREYWNIVGIFEKDKTQFTGNIYSHEDKKIRKFDIENEMKAKEIKSNLDGQNFSVAKIEKKETRRYPSPPFTTSTMQQSASTYLRFSAKQTMRIAQQLYEGIKINKEQVGLITYMRTDSLNLSNDFLSNAQKFITNYFGTNYGIDAPRRFKTKSKGAQEAHEAIRPANPERTPESIKEYLSPQQYKLYNLIWKRTIASQMAEAIFDTTKADIKSDNDYVFRASGEILKFDGFLKIYTQKEIEDKILPPLQEKDGVNLVEIKTEQKFTEPPSRYSEATLIKALEERGVGRPSTYAPTISTIQDRNYVIKNEIRKFQPTDMGMAVNDLLVKHFPDIVNIEFTAQMEKSLDDIARGEKKWIPTIKEFYKPFNENLEKKYEEVDKKEVTEEKSNKTCEKCGKNMIIKLGRYGKFLACSNFPNCKNTKPLEEPEKVEEKCEKCGAPMQIKQGRFGKFLGCSKYPECRNIKPYAKLIGMKCPKCGAGEIVEKQTKKRKIFWGCNKYPNCDWASWKKPEIK